MLQQAGEGGQRLLGRGASPGEEALGCQTPMGREGSQLQLAPRSSGTVWPTGTVGPGGRPVGGLAVGSGGLEAQALMSKGGRGKRTRIVWRGTRLGPSQVSATLPAAPRRKP